MNFKDQYQKAFKNAAPSPALQQETLELLQEARDHHIEPEQPVKRWKLAYTLSLASSVAALFFCIVMVGIFGKEGTFFQDEMADEEWFSEDSKGESDGDMNEVQDQFSPLPDSDKESSSSDQDAAEDSADKEKEQNTTDSSIHDDWVEDEAEPSPSDPKAPVFLDNNDVRSYESFSAFIQALTDKTALGYGKNYYLARELLIVPSKLPDGARFRVVDLYAQDGGYSYSYLLKENHEEYLLQVTVSGSASKTLSELSARKEALAEESILMKKSGNTRTYLFGETEKVTLTLEPVLLADPIPAEGDLDRILSVFDLERCSLTNPLLEMAY